MWYIHTYRFDSNCITPGTEFMVRLHEQLKYFVNQKVATDPSWQSVEVILSGQEVGVSLSVSVSVSLYLTLLCLFSPLPLPFFPPSVSFRLRKCMCLCVRVCTVCVRVCVCVNSLGSW